MSARSSDRTRRAALDPLGVLRATTAIVASDVASHDRVIQSRLWARALARAAAITAMLAAMIQGARRSPSN